MHTNTYKQTRLQSHVKPAMKSCAEYARVCVCVPACWRIMLHMRIKCVFVVVAVAVGLFFVAALHYWGSMY